MHNSPQKKVITEIESKITGDENKIKEMEIEITKLENNNLKINQDLSNIKLKLIEKEDYVKEFKTKLRELFNEYGLLKLDKNYKKWLNDYFKKLKIVFPKINKDQFLSESFDIIDNMLLKLNLDWSTSVKIMNYLYEDKVKLEIIDIVLKQKYPNIITEINILKNNIKTLVKEIKDNEKFLLEIKEKIKVIKGDFDKYNQEKQKNIKLEIISRITKLLYLWKNDFLDEDQIESALFDILLETPKELQNKIDKKINKWQFESLRRDFDNRNKLY